jgi:GNAT superfamily N-acetyltransferase
MNASTTPKPPNANPRIVEEPPSLLGELAAIPIRFTVHAVLDVQLRERGLGGIHLVERQVSDPYEKDYDADEAVGPSSWARRFDVSNWGFLGAHAGPRRVGGAVVAWRCEGMQMLEGRDDLAVLWDLRVHPDARGRGIGGALFTAAERWARSRGCVELKVETQNVNVPACRFYAERGCILGAVNRFAYPTYPGETQLIWRKALG